MNFDWLDIFTTILGLVYIWLEYRASIWLWLVGVVMPALDVVLYWRHGLYGDAGMAVYYTLAAFYGFVIWRFKKTRKEHKPLPIIHMPHKYYLPVTVFFFVAWGLTYYILITWTNSTIPVLDAFKPHNRLVFLVSDLLYGPAHAFFRTLKKEDLALLQITGILRVQIDSEFAFYTHRASDLAYQDFLLRYVSLLQLSPPTL